MLPELEILEEAMKQAARRAKAERLIRPLELKLRKAFKAQAVRFVRKLSSMRGKFAESLKPSDWQTAWFGAEEATLKLFSDPIEAAVAKSLGIGALANIADLGLKMSWNLKNPRAVAYLDNYGAELVKGVNQTTRDALQVILSQAAEEGWSYQRTAEAITERFAEFAVGRPQDHIDSRAHMIAVTEIGNAYVEGNLQVAQSLQSSGIQMEKYWSTVGDDKVSASICAPNEAQGWIPLDEDFQSGDARPLGHPACRCDLLTRVKE